MKPTREFLIESIKSFYSAKPSNQKKKTPKRPITKADKNNFFQTPKVPTNKKEREENTYPTPIYGQFSSSYSSCAQTRSPSPTYYKTVNDKILPEQPKHNFCSKIIIVFILILVLIILIFSCPV